MFKNIHIYKYIYMHACRNNVKRGHEFAGELGKVYGGVWKKEK